MKSEEKVIVENKTYKQVELIKERFYCKLCQHQKRFNKLEHLNQHLKARHNIQL